MFVYERFRANIFIEGNIGELYTTKKFSYQNNIRNYFLIFISDSAVWKFWKTENITYIVGWNHDRFHVRNEPKALTPK